MRGYFRGRGVADADDLTGDVFVRVAQGIGGFRGDGASLRRWVFTIAHHRYVDELRSAHRQRSRSTGEVPEIEAMPAPSGSLDADLLAAMEQLTDEQREVLVLRFVADLPIRDVGRVLGKRAGAVKMLQQRGLERLAAALDSGSGRGVAPEA